MREQANAADTPNQMPGFGQPVNVVDALTGLALHPAQTFLYSWNWKAALLSVALRAPIFLVATLHRGLAAISLAVLVEAVYSAAISGCYGAFVQKLRNARPLWASGLLIVIVMPAVLFGFDYFLHRSTGMPNLKGGMLAAGVLSLLSSLFNWYLMSRSSLLVGREVIRWPTICSACRAWCSTLLPGFPCMVTGFYAVPVFTCRYESNENRCRLKRCT